jgi:phosphoribosylformylglycinamidine synthase
VIGIVGILDDVHKAVKPDYQATGRTLLLLRGTEPGDAVDAEVEFGSSEYAKEVLGAVWGYPPGLDLEKEAALQKALVELSQQGLVDSMHDCSEGGLAVALTESGFAKGIGINADLASNGLPTEFVLFGEDASRVVISCDQEQVSRIKQIANTYGLSIETIGQTASEVVQIRVDGKVVVSSEVSDLRDGYESSLEAALKTEPEAVAAD